MLCIDKFVVWRESDNEKLPDVSFVPPMTRRRMTNLQKIVVGLANQIAPASTSYNVVFASRFGEWQQTMKLIEQFHDSHEMSQAGFSNSVHNAAVGALSILTGNKSSYVSIAAGDKTLESGILSALMNSGPTLFIFAEERTPDFYVPYLDTSVYARAIVFILSDSGAIKCKLANNNCEPLTFDKMADFLSRGEKLTTSFWEMEK